MYLSTSRRTAGVSIDEVSPPYLAISRTALADIYEQFSLGIMNIVSMSDAILRFVKAI
jgi:hypothetical protein